MKQQKRRAIVGALGVLAAALMAVPSIAEAQAPPKAPPGWEQYATKRMTAGQEFTISGTGCTEDGEPGWVAGVLGPIDSAGHGGEGIEVPAVEADEMGMWDLPVTLPSTPDAFYFVI